MRWSTRSRASTTGSRRRSRRARVASGPRRGAPPAPLPPLCGLPLRLTPCKEQVGTGQSLIAFAEVPPERARDFAAERSDAVLRLHMLLKARLVRDRMTAFYETIERPLVPVVAAMEREGIKVDPAALAELSRDFARRIADLEQAIFRAVSNDFNVGSTKRLGVVLFEKLGLPGGSKGKTRAYGTDASILEELAPLHEVPGHVLEWRQLTKLKSTYAYALA